MKSEHKLKYVIPPAINAGGRFSVVLPRRWSGALCTNKDGHTNVQSRIWISNYTYITIQHKITTPCSNFNGGLFTVGIGA